MSDDYETHIELGDACCYRSEHQEALRHYQTAMALTLGADEPRLKISRTLVSAAHERLQQGNHAEALRQLQRALSLDMDSSDIYQSLILAYTAYCEKLLAVGSLDVAVRTMKHVLLLDPDQPRLRLMLEAALKMRGGISSSASRSQPPSLLTRERIVLFIPSPVSSGTLLLGQLLTEILREEYGFSDITYAPVTNTRNLINYPLPEYDYLQALRANSNNAFLCQHYFYQPEVLKYLEDPQIKPVMMKRDPRDSLVSSLNLFYYNDEVNKVTNNRMRYQSFDEYVDAHLVEGARWYLEYYKSWSGVPGMYQISFEQIKTDGFSCLRRLLNHAGLNVPNNVIYRALYLTDFRTITNRNPGDEVKNPARFMRSGVSGEWSTFFNLRQQHLLKRELGELLIDLGYKEDFLW